MDRNDFAEQAKWKLQEAVHHDLCTDIMTKEFATLKPGPCDYHNVAPNSYNLSIQYERDKKNDDKKKIDDKKKQEKKVKLSKK